MISFSKYLEHREKNESCANSRVATGPYRSLYPPLYVAPSGRITPQAGNLDIPKKKDEHPKPKEMDPGSGMPKS